MKCNPTKRPMLFSRCYKVLLLYMSLSFIARGDKQPYGPILCNKSVLKSPKHLRFPNLIQALNPMAEKYLHGNATNIQFKGYNVATANKHAEHLYRKLLPSVNSIWSNMQFRAKQISNHYVPRDISDLERSNNSDSPVSLRIQNSCPGSGIIITNRFGNISTGKYKEGDSCSWIVSPDTLVNSSVIYPVQLEFTTFNLNPWCDSVQVQQCDTPSCDYDTSTTIGNFWGWRSPPQLISTSKVTKITFQSQSGCSKPNSEFSLSYNVLCPSGYHGAASELCRPCKSKCEGEEVLIGSCSAGSKFDTTWCGCPVGKYRSDNGNCVNCSITCGTGGGIYHGALLFRLMIIF